MVESLGPPPPEGTVVVGDTKKHHLDARGKREITDDSSTMGSDRSLSSSWMTHFLHSHQWQMPPLSVVTRKKQGHKQESKSRSSTSKAVWVVRIVFCVCLAVVALTLGMLAHFIIERSETQLAEQQFSVVAHRALDLAQEKASQGGMGTASMAQIASYANPFAKDWPMVFIPAFETIVAQLMEMYNSAEMSFLPKVRPGGEEQKAFEDFAYDYFQKIRKPPFPNDTAIYHDPYLRGIHGGDDSLNTSHGLYHDTTGVPKWWNGSRHNFQFPVLQHDQGPFFLLMRNYYLHEPKGRLLDDMIDCTEERRWKEDVDMDCSQMTGFLWRRSSQFLYPIYPAMDPFQFTGVLQSRIRWDHILEKLFEGEEHVRGIFAVIKYQDTAFTYYVDHGQTNLTGNGELHDATYDHHGIQGTLAGEIGSSKSYSLTLYPTDAFFGEYRTKNPVVAAWGAVAIVMLMSLMFLVYDFYVRREFAAKQHLLHAKRNFVRFISHEVRTPLNAVCMGEALLIDELKAAANAEKYRSNNSGGEGSPSPSDAESIKQWLGLAQDIMNNAQGSVDVLNDILNYDKIQMSNLSLELTVLPIWTLVAECTKEFRLQAKKKSVKLVLDFSLLQSGCGTVEANNNHIIQLSPDMQTRKVVGDKIRISQVVRNLVSNGLKFTKEGGSLTVRASWLKPSSSALAKQGTETTFTLKDGEEVSFVKSGIAQIEVIDTGVGMSQDQLSKVFAENVQFNVNELQGGQGSGLGLYISKGIVEQHDGSLEVSSEGIGHGTTFTCTLPLCYVPDLDENLSELGSTGNALLQEPKEILPLKILIVDDIEMNRRLLGKLSTNRGHIVTDAVHGQDAVDQVAQAMHQAGHSKPFDTILMDYEMPVLNGPDATKKIRDLGCDSFIVGITGHVLAEDEKHFKSLGADAVLAKPVQYPELEKVWREHGISGHKTNEMV